MVERDGDGLTGKAEKGCKKEVVDLVTEGARVYREDRCGRMTVPASRLQ